MDDDERREILRGERAKMRAKIGDALSITNDPEVVDSPVVGWVVIVETALPEGRAFGVMMGNASDDDLMPWQFKGYLNHALDVVQDPETS